MAFQVKNSQCDFLFILQESDQKMYKWKKTAIMRKYPVLFGPLLSLSAHTVIAMTIYKLNADNVNHNRKNIILPLVDITWQKTHEMPIPIHTKKISTTKPVKMNSTTSNRKSALQNNNIPHDLKPSIYNEMPTYPARAKNQEVESSFSVSLVLDKKGNVRNIIFPKTDEPPSLFKAEVVKKLSKWKFISKKNLESIQINVPLQFKLAI